MGQVALCFFIRIWQCHQDDELPIPLLISEEILTDIEYLYDCIMGHIDDLEDKDFIDITHRLFGHLFFNIHPELDMSTDKDLFNFFVICLNTTFDGNFKPPTLIATSCSTLVHIMRLVSIKEINFKRNSQEYLDNPLPDGTLRQVNGQIQFLIQAANISPNLID